MNAGRAGACVLCRGIARRDASVEQHREVLEASAAKDARAGATDAHELISTILVDASAMQAYATLLPPYDLLIQLLELTIMSGPL